MRSSTKETRRKNKFLQPAFVSSPILFPHFLWCVMLTILPLVFLSLLSLPMGMFVRSRRCVVVFGGRLLGKLNTETLPTSIILSVPPWFFSSEFCIVSDPNGNLFPIFHACTHTQSSLLNPNGKICFLVCLCVGALVPSCGIEKLCHRSFCFSLPRCTVAGRSIHKQQANISGEEKLTLFYARTSFVDFLQKKQRTTRLREICFLFPFGPFLSPPLSHCSVRKSERKVKYLEVGTFLASSTQCAVEWNLVEKQCGSYRLLFHRALKQPPPPHGRRVDEVEKGAIIFIHRARSG